MGEYRDDSNKHRRQGYFYVNSGTGISMDNLDELIDEQRTDGRGRVELSAVRTDLKDESIDLVGKPAIRSYLETLTGLGKRHVNRSMMPALGNENFVKHWLGDNCFPATSINSLSMFAENHLTQAKEKRTENLYRRPSKK